LKKNHIQNLFFGYTRYIPKVTPTYKISILAPTTSEGKKMQANLHNSVLSLVGAKVRGRFANITTENLFSEKPDMQTR
jgi:hypothetical protein